MFSLRLPPFEPAARPGGGPRRCSIEALGRAGRARRAGRASSLLLEPLNRYEDYMVNRLDAGGGARRGGRRDSGCDSVRVCADLFHMNIEEDDLRRALSAPPGHYLASRAGRATPTGSSPAPGTWTAPLRWCVRCCEIDYRGWLALECRLRGEPQEALPAAVAFLAQYLDSGEAHDRT